MPAPDPLVGYLSFTFLSGMSAHSSTSGNNVLLVSDSDEPLALWDKLLAHQLNRLHRAFSVFIFNQRGQLLLQQRAAEKYHSGGLWSNTCCGHPLLPDSVNREARTRLQVEMGLDTPLAFLFKFRYQVSFADGLHEHEWDHVLVGICNDTPVPNPAEASAYRWIDWPVLLHELGQRPEQFTVWFHQIIERQEIHDFVIAYKNQ